MRVKLCVLVLLMSLCCGVNAQKTGNKKAVPKATISKSTDEGVIAPPLVEPSEINFDTTAVPDDALTAKIFSLLTLTHALEKDVELAGKSLDAAFAGKEDDDTVKEFKKRFMAELTVGRARRWMTNLYIRQYRNSFTIEEVQALIDFYKTPHGITIMQKQAAMLGNVMSEAQKIGSYLGNTVMQEILKDQTSK